LGNAWPALDIYVPGCDPQFQDLVVAELDDFHPTAIQEDDDGRKLRVFFSRSDDRDAAERAVATAFDKHLFTQPIDVEDEDWAARTQAALRSVRVGRVIVAPPWEKEIGSRFPHDSPLSIVIQPSMGFGTGHHATTRLMLKALQTIDLHDRNVLDIGCGSGVLAIAAVALGAESAVGIDVDPDALRSAAENVRLNGAGDRVRLQQVDVRQFRSACFVVLANLTGALLEQQASTLAGLVLPGGHLVASGFMDTQTTVIPALEKFLMLQHVDREDEWLSATFWRPIDPSRCTAGARQQ
jgi:ribosomal protein L11 methyltransferase